MPTTNAPAAKKALMDLLKAQAAPGGRLDGPSMGLPVGQSVEVTYAWNGNVGENSIYGGGWRFVAHDAVDEGPGLLVAEVVTVSVYAKAVARPACDVEETDARCTIMINAIGAVIIAQPKLAGQLSVVGIAAGLGDYQTLDNETSSTYALQVDISSMVTWG